MPAIFKKTSTFVLLILLCVTMIMAACQSRPAKDELCVSAAISLKDALLEIAKGFESSNPGCKIVFNFGASGQLAEQIAQGAPTDVFISASSEFIERLEDKGLILRGSVQKIAGNKLVLITSRQSIARLEDLCSVERIAIGNPKTVPAGAHAVEALRSAKIYDSLIKSQALVFAEDAKQIVAYVDGGDVDAGIVYNTDAKLADRARLCCVVPASYTKPVEYVLALIENSAHRNASEQFLKFALEPGSQAILAKWGFTE